MIRNADPKHPDSEKWYGLRWDATELQNSPIVSAVWTLPVGITALESEFTGFISSLKVSGGDLGEDYLAWVAITTASGETLHESLLIKIRKYGH